MMARRLESLSGTMVLVLAVLTVCVSAGVGTHGFAGGAIFLIMGLGVAGVYVAAGRQSQSDSARSALKWLALLVLSAGLLLVETLIGIIGFGVFLLPLSFVALITAIFEIIVQLNLALSGGRKSPKH